MNIFIKEVMNVERQSILGKIQGLCVPHTYRFKLGCVDPGYNTFRTLKYLTRNRKLIGSHVISSFSKSMTLREGNARRISKPAGEICKSGL